MAAMDEELREVLLADERIAYALLLIAQQDVDVAIGLRSGVKLNAAAINHLIFQLQRAAERDVDLVMLDDAPPGLAYRIFRDGRLLVDGDRQARVNRQTRAILEHLDFEAFQSQIALPANPAVILNAVGRIREILPRTAAQLANDRATRESVILNFFVAIQEALRVAAHWLSDAGLVIPETYGDFFHALGEHGMIERESARRLVAATAVRDFTGQHDRAIDVDRLHAVVSMSLDDLAALCPS
jgi:uncharacterized protein YutE (UPF0331/DUF86 family)